MQAASLPRPRRAHGKRCAPAELGDGSFARGDMSESGARSSKRIRRKSSDATDPPCRKTVPPASIPNRPRRAVARKTVSPTSQHAGCETGAVQIGEIGCEPESAERRSPAPVANEPRHTQPLPTLDGRAYPNGLCSTVPESVAAAQAALCAHLRARMGACAYVCIFFFFS